MVILGIMVKRFKWYWLISGYNTMSRALKENVDIEGLGNFLGNWLFILGGLFLAGGLLNRLGVLYLDLLFWGLFIVGIFFMLVGAQRFDHNPRTTRDRIIMGLVLSSLILVGLFVAGMINYGSRSPSVEVTDDFLKIGGMYGFNLPLSDIEEIVLKETMPPITRKVNGFNAGPVIIFIFYFNVDWCQFVSYH